MEVLDDQTSRGQLLRMPEEEARSKFPGLVVASLEPTRKVHPNGHERLPIASDSKQGLAGKIHPGRVHSNMVGPFCVASASRQ